MGGSHRDGAEGFRQAPFILQRFEKIETLRGAYVDFDANETRSFNARVRLCPFYFVVGDDAKLGGILATVCPADRKSCTECPMP